MSRKLAKTFRLLQLLPVLMLSACSAVQLVNGVSRIYPVDIAKDLTFGDNPRDRMDIYRPQEKSADREKTPVIVFFFGGSWNRGEKSEYEFVGRKLASLGYITVVPNYRIYPEVTYPEFLKDGAKAIKIAMTELQKPEYAYLSPSSQIILMGHSAGAYNAAMLAMDDRWLARENIRRDELVKGLIGMAGAYNIYPIKVPEVKPVFNHPSYPPESQPIDFVQDSSTPTLLLAPESDELVSIEKNTLSLKRALEAKGTTVTLSTVSGTDHISLIGTLSPVLFFKGSSVDPIRDFIASLPDS